MTGRSKSIKTIAAAAALVTLATAAGGATDRNCYVPPFLLETGTSLKRVTKSAKQDRRLSILLFSGSPSQTGGTKGLRSYPTYLENALRERLPGVEVKVEVHAKARQSTGELLALLPKTIDDVKPALVIWQMGTVDTFRQTSVLTFGRNLIQGTKVISEEGADTILLNMQFSPRTDRLVNYRSYLDEIRDAAAASSAPLFDRYEIMRYWNAVGAFDLMSLKNDGLYEKIHICIGELLADFILRGAGLREDKGIGG